MSGFLNYLDKLEESKKKAVVKVGKEVKPVVFKTKPSEPMPKAKGVVIPKTTVNDKSDAKTTDELRKKVITGNKIVAKNVESKEGVIKKGDNKVKKESALVSKAKLIVEGLPETATLSETHKAKVERKNISETASRASDLL